MPGAVAPGANLATANFGTSGAGGALNNASSGYNAAQQNLMKSLQASQNTTSSQQMQLGQQLNQNQANTAQNMASRGLGNTTVAGAMSQVPLQTFNQGMAQVQNQGALRQMGAYQNLAGLQAQGGQAMTNNLAPYAQTNFTTNLMKSMQPPIQGSMPQSDFSQAQHQQGQGYDAASLQNLMAMQNWQQNGYSPGVQQTQTADQQAQQAALAAQYAAINGQ